MHDNYSELARTNKYGLQIDKLLADAKRANAIALYALFSNHDSHSMCGGKHEGHDEGAFIAGGRRIYDSFIAGPRQRVDANGLLALSNPFSCFACCPLVHKEDGLRRYLDQYYSHETEADGPVTERNVGIHAGLPSNLSSFLERSRENAPGWWEAHFQDVIEQFNALLVYDFRNRNVFADAK